MALTVLSSVLFNAITAPWRSHNTPLRPPWPVCDPQHLQVTEIAPGVSKKMLSDPEGSYLKPNDGSSVTLLVTTRAPDGTVWQPETEVTFTTDDEQVGVGAHTHTHTLLVL